MRIRTKLKTPIHDKKKQIKHVELSNVFFYIKKIIKKLMHASS
jgi:hypothetical protein